MSPPQGLAAPIPNSRGAAADEGRGAGRGASGASEAAKPVPIPRRREQKNGDWRPAACPQFLPIEWRPKAGTALQEWQSPAF
jgi:hypothetical protein